MIEDSIWTFIKNLKDCPFDAKRRKASMTKQSTLMTIFNILGVNWTCLANDDRYVLNQFSNVVSNMTLEVSSVVLLFLAFNGMAMP